MITLKVYQVLQEHISKVQAGVSNPKSLIFENCGQNKEITQLSKK
jgi:hypothetical protein